MPRLQRNENSKSAPGLQDSLTSNDGLESMVPDRKKTENTFVNKKRSVPDVPGEVIHAFPLWRNAKKNAGKAEEALKTYKTQIDGASRDGQKRLEKTDGITKSKTANIGKKLPTPPKYPSSSGKRFRGRSGRKSPSTSPVEKSKSKVVDSKSAPNNTIDSSNISTGQLSVDVGNNEDDGSSIVEQIEFGTTLSNNSNLRNSQSPRIAKTGAVLFRQSLSPTPFQWKKGEKIGHGTYGDVFMALNQVTGELFCVKQIRVQPGVVEN